MNITLWAIAGGGIGLLGAIWKAYRVGYQAGRAEFERKFKKRLGSEVVDALIANIDDPNSIFVLKSKSKED